MNIRKDGGIDILTLQEMLEGQVAVLSSGYLDGNSTLELLRSLRKSKLYRPDQKSYILYPDKPLSRFLGKNIIPAREIIKYELLNLALKRNDYRLVKPVGDGSYQFNARFRNADDVGQMLERMKDQYDPLLIGKEGKGITSLFEHIFNHASFTGRSGTFFKYEGLGSIYWHMVSKLALAVQECFFESLDRKEPESVTGYLAKFYHEIQEGLGIHKDPAVYGAFTTDPYSHTPRHAGVQQPGMTGQVKEDILSRMGELGAGQNSSSACVAEKE